MPKPKRTQATPGPMRWTYNPARAEVRCDSVTQTLIADVYDHDDGHLLASAPDLLAALEALTKTCEVMGGRGWADIKDARAAIAKARGGKGRK